MTLEITAQKVICAETQTSFQALLTAAINNGWQVDSDSVIIVAGNRSDWFCFATLYKVEEKPDTDSGVFMSKGGELVPLE